MSPSVIYGGPRRHNQAHPGRRPRDGNPWKKDTPMTQNRRPCRGRPNMQRFRKVRWTLVGGHSGSGMGHFPWAFETVSFTHGYYWIPLRDVDAIPIREFSEKRVPGRKLFCRRVASLAFRFLKVISLIFSPPWGRTIFRKPENHPATAARNS
jgi:hypothetical protein